MRDVCFDMLDQRSAAVVGLAVHLGSTTPSRRKTASATCLCRIRSTGPAGTGPTDEAQEAVEAAARDTGLIDQARQRAERVLCGAFEAIGSKLQSTQVT